MTRFISQSNRGWSAFNFKQLWPFDRCIRCCTAERVLNGSFRGLIHVVNPLSYWDVQRTTQWLFERISPAGHRSPWPRQDDFDSSIMYGGNHAPLAGGPGQEPLGAPPALHPRSTRAPPALHPRYDRCCDLNFCSRPTIEIIEKKNPINQIVIIEKNLLIASWFSNVRHAIQNSNLNYIFITV